MISSSTIGRLLLCICLLGFKSTHAQLLEKRTPSGKGYYINLPVGYDQSAGKKHPVIVFLHGIGQKGNGSNLSLKKLLLNGPLTQLDEDLSLCVQNEGRRECFIIISPQLPSKYRSWLDDYVYSFLDEVMNDGNLRYDKDRVYLTGYSLGGNGVYKVLGSDKNIPNRWAAAAPVAAWGNRKNACKIASAGASTWAFHGEQDRTVTFASGKNMHLAVDQCSQVENKFTALKNVGHDSWKNAYKVKNPASQNLYKWFLSNKLGEAREKTTRSEPAPTPEKEKEVSIEKLALAGISAFNETTEGTNFYKITDLPSVLKEVSGIQADSGGVWAHNDSGNLPFLFKISPTGEILYKIKISGASNVDWEDMTADDQGNLYIADVGNNSNKRRRFIIYKIDIRNVTRSTLKLPSQRIIFTLPDQQAFPPDNKHLNFDFEALSWKDNNLYLFSKNRTKPFNGVVKMYRIPTEKGEHQAELLDSLSLGTDGMLNHWITGADISPDGQTLALLSSDRVFLFAGFDGKRLDPGSLKVIPLNHFSQKEAITFLNKDTLYIADENVKGLLSNTLYSLNIED